MALRVSPKAIEVTGALEKQHAIAAIGEQAVGLAACWRLAFDARMPADTVGEAALEISPDGTTTNVRVTLDAEGTVADTLGDCMAREISSWTFPRSDVGSILTYPFELGTVELPKE